MDRQQRIISTLSQYFDPSLLVVVDDSAKHAGHAGAAEGGQTHYTITISAQSLEGKSRIKQHQAIMDVLKNEFTSGLHALAINIQ